MGNVADKYKLPEKKISNEVSDGLTTDLQKLRKNMMTIEEKREILKNLDLFVLDNSLRETTVGQIFGHTLENKWEIYNEVDFDFIRFFVYNSKGFATYLLRIEEFYSINR